MKAILVINMPENCVECPCEQHGLCLVKCGAVESIDRPLWCPLKPMPEKKMSNAGFYWNDTPKDGWNACLEELTK